MSDAAMQAGAVPTERLMGFLRGANARRMRWDLAAAGAAGAAGWVAAALGAVAIDAAAGLPPRGLVTLDALLACVAGAVLLRLLAVAWRRRFRARRVAVQLERALGIDDSRLIAAVDLAGPGGASAVTSEALRRDAVRRGDELAAELPATAAVDRGAFLQSLRWLGGALASAVVAYIAVPGVFHAVIPRLLEPYADHPPFTLLRFAVTTQPQTVIQGHKAAIQVTITGPMLPDRATLVWDPAQEGEEPRAVPLLASAQGGDEAARRFVLRLDRVEGDRTFYIDTPNGRSGRYTLDAVPVPLFEDVRVRYDFPAYTLWPSKREPLGPGGVKAIEGTTVTLEVRSNVPLEGGLLTLPVGDTPRETRLVPDSAEPTHGAFQFVVSTAGEAEAVLQSGGLATPDPLQMKITSVPDAKPRVAFAQPTPAVIAVEGWTVDVVVAASDDVEVTAVTLQRALNDAAPSSMGLMRSGDDRRRTQAHHRIDLGAMGARAGDTITYFATAYDNKPERQFAQTPVQSIHVISLAEYEEYARTQYHAEDLAAEWAEFQKRLDALQAQREHALNELSQLQQQAAAGEPLTPEQQARAVELEKELERYGAEALGLAADLRERAEQATLYEFEKPYKDRLKQLEQAMQMQAGEADATRRALQQARQSPVRESLERLSMQAERFRERDQPFESSSAQQRQEMTEDLERVRLADEMVGAAERLRQVVVKQRDLATRMQQFRQRDTLTPEEQRLATAMAEEQAELRRELGDAQEALDDASSRATELLPKMSGAAKVICEKLTSLDVPPDQLAAEQGAYSGQGSSAASSARVAAEKLDTLLSNCQAMGGDSSDLDGCLSLPRETWQNAMNQMAQGRNVPSFGRQGGGGTGFMGSSARMSILGPAPQNGQGDGPDRSSGRADGRGGAAAAMGEEGEADDAERIDAQAAAERSGGVSVLMGVPAQYRDTAEAYFHRLVEDERYDQDKARGPEAER